MPSPAGHLLAGVAIAWAAEAVEPRRSHAFESDSQPPALPVVTPLVLACAVLALAPDLDILIASHRTYTHSVGAVGASALVGGLIARVVGAPGLATGLACGAAVASHVLLDWLGHDGTPPIGLMALWPLSASYFYSGVDLFADVSRRWWKPGEFILKNAISIARELAILGPIAWLAWRARSRSVLAPRPQPLAPSP